MGVWLVVGMVVDPVQRQDAVQNPSRIDSRSAPQICRHDSNTQYVEKQIYDEKREVSLSICLQI